jgi:hypothetical protein
MKLPFVSRERFDEKAAEVERERARADKIQEDLDALRTKFLDYIDRHRVAPLTIGEDTDLGSIQPIAGRPTIANVISDANSAAYRAAQNGKSITREIEEASAKILSKGKVANGR